MVGQHRLFIGSYPGYGTFSQVPRPISAVGMTPHQQYERARFDLGHPVGSIPVSHIVWWPLMLVAVVIVLLASFVLVMRRPKSDPSKTT